MTRAFLLGALLLAPPLAFGEAGSSAKFKSLLKKIQAEPGITALRAEIIALAKTMAPKPQEPEEVDELKGLAAAKFERAKSESDFADAAEVFEKVTLAAPWVGDYYLNLGLALEKAGKPEAAIEDLRLYLKANPAAPDAKKVLTRIGRLRAAAESASKPSKAPPAPPRQAEVDLTGSWSTCSKGFGPPCPAKNEAWIFRREDGEWKSNHIDYFVEITGRQVVLRQRRDISGYMDYTMQMSDDGRTMTGTMFQHIPRGWAADECQVRDCDFTYDETLTKNQ